MSASTTQSVVRKQLCAMGCELFEIGVLRIDGRMLLRSSWSADQIDAALAWLRPENARGAQIFVRPHGAHALSLVDDLSAETIPRMTDAGFQPAAVIETSPGNFQVWLNHGRILFDRTLSTQSAKELARRFGGDPSSADWRHFGRLAGFTNQKPKRRLQTGFPPFVRLHECEGRIYMAAREFLENVKSLARKASAESSTRRMNGATSNDDSVRSLSDFHADPRRRLSSRRHGLGLTRNEARPFGTTNQRRNTACSRSLKKRRTYAPAQLRATDRDQGGQYGRAAPLNALLRYGRRGVTKSPHGTGAPAVSASLRLMWCAAAPLQARHPTGRFALSRSQAAHPADRDYAQPSRFGCDGCASKMARVKENRHALAFSKRAQKGETRWTHV